MGAEEVTEMSVLSAMIQVSNGKLGSQDGILRRAEVGVHYVVSVGTYTALGRVVSTSLHKR